MKTIAFEDEGGSHTRGDKCSACCCPRDECDRPGCDGNIHLMVVDEVSYGDDDWGWIHAERCDKCDYECSNNGEFY